MMKSDSFERSGDLVPTTDREMENLLLQPQEDQAEQLLRAIGQWMDKADQTLDELERNDDLVRSAILRTCQEFADGIGNLATELEQHSPEERKRLAQACWQDAQRYRQYQLQQQHENEEELLQLSQVDWIQALSGATSLLRDIESAFRDIGTTDAEELADVGLSLARLFLLSLQNLHSTITPDDLVIATTGRSIASNANTVEIEEVTDEDENDEPPPSQQQQQHNRKTDRKYNTSRRVRVLWPPLGPSVADACDWGKSWASQQPLLAVALGLTLWPAAIGACVVGGSLVAADSFLQDCYGKYQETPLLQTVEQGAAQVVQSARFTWLCTRLVGKQSLRVVGRQVERHGGVGQIAGNVGGFAIDRALHPIDTVQKTFAGVAWTVGAITDTINQALKNREEDRQMVELQ